MSVQQDEKLWSFLERVVAEEGAKLFDVEAPTARIVSQDYEEEDGGSRGGVLRVFITRDADSGSTDNESGSSLVEGAAKEDELEVEGGDQAPKRLGVSLDQCARVAKRLLDLDEQDPFVPDGCELEVSSPGINRRLRRPEHFVSAVGERVKIKFRNDKGGVQVVTGTVTSCVGDVLAMVGEGTGVEVSMPLADIKEARVDFRFG
jgi:ribosome maturation factor RimP